MKLAVPIFSNDGEIYNEVETRKPKSKVLTRAYEVMQKEGAFSAMVEFLSGCISSITSIDGKIIDNPNLIRRLSGLMPYVSAEAVSLEIIGTLNKDDVIDGIYTCPRCGEKIIGEYDPRTGLDTRDKVSDLGVSMLKENEYINEIAVTPEEPVKFYNKKTGEVIQTVEHFSVRYPTLNDCIISSRGMQKGEEVRVQLKIYSQSLLKVNGEIADDKWKKMWGNLLFDELYPEDIAQIGNILQNLGIEKTVEKVCNNCGKVWEATVNTSNFFASGLQPA